MKISILLITYNHEKYIRQAIASILMQKELDDYEIIVSDDNSTDNTVSLVAEALDKFSNVKIYSNEINKGITKNYQKAFSLCSGEYIFILEGDDYWLDPYKVKKQTEFLNNHPFCVMCGHPYYMQKGELSDFTDTSANKAEYYNLFDCKDIILDPGLVNNFSVGCYRKSILQKISDETYEVTSYDWMINISVANFGFIGRINQPMSVYRVSDSGAWSGRSEQHQIEGTIAILPEYNRILNNKYHAFFEIKKQLLENQLNHIKGVPSGKIKLKDLFPPFFISLSKWIIPPVIIKFLRG